MAALQSRLLLCIPLLQLLSGLTDAAALTGRGRRYDEVMLEKRAIPTGWSSQGCWTDSVNSRVLGQYATTAATMTPESCIAFCASNNAPYAGVEYGNECYCSGYLSASSSHVADTDCNMACAGNSSQVCGAGNRLNVYHLDSDTGSSANTGPAHNAGPANWGFLGCYTDSVQARTLPVGGQTDGGGAKLTVALCTQACQKQGYKYSGVEYSGECYCGNNLPDSYLAPDGFAGCNMVCNGNSSEYCGGPNRLDVFGYQMRSTIAPKWANLGCYSDQVGSRTLLNGVGVLGGTGNMTVENCQNACFNAKFNIAGLEYAQECWCDNVYNNGGGPASDGSAQCNMACKGNGKQTCGGPNRLNVYTYVAGPSSSTTTTTTTTTTVASTTALSTSAAVTTSLVTTSSLGSNSTITDSSGVITTTTPVAVTTTTTMTTTTTTSGSTGLPSGFSYQGCYVDGAYGRILTQVADTQTMTIENCINQCTSLNYGIAGLEYTSQCFCGNALVNGATLASADNQCAMTCGGNKQQICGGPNRISLYTSKSNFTSYKRPTAQNTTLPGNWKYQGCLTDTPQPRVLQYEINMGANLSVPNCLNLCNEFGYSAGAVEYGQQCYCGDDGDRVNAGARFRLETDCNTPCPSQPETLCGGASAMNYYTWDSRNTWTQAVGDAAGRYDYLIDGPVIPLITQVTKTGKILFTEKHGTGYGKTTGAWELDITALNDTNAVWRELQGLRTDVFCSAGLMLPDKAGRTINIGGWSDTSTYGVRLYYPDGSPGVPGENGWEENVKEVHLQTGRWYPSAMQLTNGSLLVVGGEKGANGARVPNLEVLPKPDGGSVLYMDWLDRTDPLNLYPFLTYLPSGGIAVFYYNEARILDEHTFNTLRVLPNMPGSVNRPDGGRTYPLEGTMALAPMSAPYTDPLTVIVCGGSTPNQGFALDNCITTQPENPAANWTIERMPSRRVLTSMAALPDGTFIIMNGARQGQAGFGLANDGNHEALLYDPSKPLYNRFTRLANTTIDRLYHSEAILLMDGRILVSGSDPEDNSPTPHLQEYRVEIFTPPYLMGDRANNRPSYTVNYTDWSYGGSYPIQITGGDVGKIALMAATSSTHGNSMGMRTLFPAYSCSGGTCTITAPPNGYVTGGPGWFMLFVLNSAGTPSIAQWVRIGGDPAGLGNWPPYDDFTLPGV